ncbi:hypothetical protein FHR71_000719 [Methylobacterium sp. RAS18]|nr:hypothetical protein [Methylobacterium sp. RAS18]
MAIFNRLRLPDVAGQPTLREAAGEWMRDLVVAIFGAYDPEAKVRHVERAVIQLVGAAVSASGRDMMVRSEDVEGVGSFSYYVQGASAALPHPEAEATLAQYRRMAFA